MKKTIITLIAAAAVIAAAVFGAINIIKHDQSANAEAAGGSKVIWYHPSDENEPEPDYSNYSGMSEQELDAYITAEMNAQAGADRAYDAFLEAVEAAAEIPEGMHYPDWIGGCWIGHDNMLHIAFARCADDAARELVEKALSGYSSKVFYEEDMPYSYNELYRAKDGAADYLLEKGFKLTDFGLDERFNRIRIGAPSEELEAVAACRAELEALFPYPIVFVEHGYAVPD